MDAREYETLLRVVAVQEESVQVLEASWVIVCAMFVFLMQLGFSFLEAGSVRSSSVLNIMIKNLADTALGSVVWYAVGFGFAFGDATPNHLSGFIGNSGFFMDSHSYDGPARVFVSMLFTTAAITIVSGALAERVHPLGYFTVVVVMSAISIPILTYWMWSKHGWLSPLREPTVVGEGALDFAGAGVVHFSGGLWAFVGAVILGPRQLPGGLDVFSADGKKAVQGHDKFHHAGGTLLLWLGWYAFNSAGAEMMSDSDGYVIANSFAVTTLSAATSLISMLIYSQLGLDFLDLRYMCNGALVGLVSSTGPCAYVPPWAGVPIGGVASAVYAAWHHLTQRFRIDDVVDASAVHLAGGVWGMIATGLFADPGHVQRATNMLGRTQAGLLMGGNGEQLAVQILAVASIAGITVPIAVATFLLSRRCGILRVPVEAELQGVDVHLHKQTTYTYTEGIKVQGDKHRVQLPVTPLESNSPDWSHTSEAGILPWAWSGLPDRAGPWLFFLTLTTAVSAAAAADDGWPLRRAGVHPLDDAATVGARLSAVEQTQADLKTNSDHSWHVICATIVFSMQLGFSFLEAGGVRSTSVQNIVFKNLADCSVGALVWWAVGYGFAFGGSTAERTFLGDQDFFLLTNGDIGSTKQVQFFVSWTYMTTATTIVSGAVAERIRLSAYISIVAVISGLAYPALAHWMWSEQGWLSPWNKDAVLGNGALDFAGSCVIHLSGGCWALTGAYILGPRRLPGDVDIFSDQGQELVTAHNKFQLAAGTFLLWFGWYAFNSGSVTTLSNGGTSVISNACLVTTLGAASAVVACMAVSQLVAGYVHLGHACNSALAGLVSVTAGCAYVPPWSGLITGPAGAGVYYLWHRLLLRLRIDDVIDASGVHLAAGVVGTLAVGLFAEEDRTRTALAGSVANPTYGVFMGGDGRLLAAQLLAIAVTMVWSVSCCGITCRIVHHVFGLRVDLQAELKGLDATMHNSLSYDYLTLIQQQKLRAVTDLRKAEAVTDALIAFDLDGADGILNEEAGGVQSSNLNRVLKRLIGNLRLYQPFLPQALLIAEVQDETEVEVNMSAEDLQRFSNTNPLKAPSTSRTGSPRRDSDSSGDSASPPDRARLNRQRLAQRLREVGTLRPRHATLLRTDLRHPTMAASLGLSTSVSQSVAQSDAGWAKMYADFCHRVVVIVGRRNGILVALSSGAVIASWNAASPAPGHETMACRTALALAHELPRDMAPWGSAVVSGKVHVGFVGGDDARMPCCAGFPQPLAIMLVSLAQSIGCLCLTHGRVYDKVRHVFRARPVDAVELGFTVDVVYELVGATELAEHETFVRAFSLLRTLELDEAVSEFAGYLSKVDGDPMAQRLLRIALSLQQTPLLLRGRKQYTRMVLDADYFADEALIPADIAAKLAKSHRDSRTFRPPSTLSHHSGLEEDRLRQELRKGTDVEHGLPKSFSDTQGLTWHLSAKVLGKGSFGAVLMGMGDNGTMVAIKAIPLETEAASVTTDCPAAAPVFFTPLAGFGGSNTPPVQPEISPVQEVRVPTYSSNGRSDEGDASEHTVPKACSVHVAAPETSEADPHIDDLPLLPDACTSGKGSPDAPETHPLRRRQAESKSQGSAISGWDSPQPQGGSDGGKWAVKQHPERRQVASTAQVDQLLREVGVMSRLRHDHVVSYMGSAVCSGHVLIVMEYLPGGSLMSVLDQFSGQIPEGTVRRYTSDVLQGLAFLHDSSIVHRDLKPHNVLVTTDGVCKLADFGTSQELQLLTGEELAGTPHYMAPEACPGGSGAQKASDVWSFGIMFLQLVTGQIPWGKEYGAGYRFMTMMSSQDMVPPISQSLSKDAKNFVTPTVDRIPSKRPTAQRLLGHPFLIA
eukprot:TRINITY_DN15034_c0_g1_i1.p1 TRINITY_DN15034_c0_g1~~TRINITY_DN15034_c0_g1_i1.p1  ORF type:complete len:1856 (+),score=383.59 TRINITY_DN15034_c0_g1_i1:189-5756(+)